MAGPKVETLLRKPLPFLFDPKNKLYPITMVVATCLLALSTLTTTICILDPPGLTSYTTISTNEETDYLVTFIIISSGLSQSLLSIAWIHYHRDLIFSIKTKIYKLQKGVCSDKDLTWFSKEIRICYLLVVSLTILEGTVEVTILGQLCGYLGFIINVTFSFAISGQLNILLVYLGSIYKSLLDMKDCESSIKRYRFLSDICNDVWRLYKLPVLLISTWNLLTSFAHVYLLFYPAFPGRTFLNILYAIWIYLFFIPTITIIRSCNYVNRKAKKFNEDIYWKMAKDKSNGLLNNELLDFHIIVCEEPSFSACGFFTFDNSLICSIISQITTYLVIILQVARTSPVTIEPTS